MRQIAALVDRLDAEIARTEGVFEREYLKARRAALLARFGLFSEARFALAGLRSQSQRLRHPVLLAWAAHIDGLIDHCETLAPAAREKFRRAHALAATTDDAALRAECAAWLSTSDLNANDLDATICHALEALRFAPADGHAARARVALVVANAWRYAGNDAHAQSWYQRARRDAAVEGDVSLISILLHNMAAFRVGRISLEHAFDAADTADVQRVLLEAESTGNYDAGVGNEQLLAEMPLLRAQLMTVLGQYEDAIALIDAQLPRARSEGQGHREARFLADAAYAEARLQRLDKAARRVRQVEATLPLITEADDLAVVHARLASVSRALGRAAQAETHQHEAAAALARHVADQARWARALTAAELV